MLSVNHSNFIWSHNNRAHVQGTLRLADFLNKVHSLFWWSMVKHNRHLGKREKGLTVQPLHYLQEYLTVQETQNCLKKKIALFFFTDKERCNYTNLLVPILYWCHLQRNKIQKLLASLVNFLKLIKVTNTYEREWEWEWEQVQPTG